MKRETGLARWLPLVAVVLASLWVVSGLRGPKDEEWLISEFGRLPVVDQGRVKPLDTLARTSLLVLSKKQRLYTDGQRGTVARDKDLEKALATRWLLDVMARPEQARSYDVIRIDHPDLVGLAGGDREHKFYSMADLLTNGQALDAQFRNAHEAQQDALTGYQRKVLELSRQVSLYFRLEDPTSLLLIPPPDGEGDWQTVAAARHATHEGGDPTPEAVYLAGALLAWQEGRREDFNAAVTDWTASLEQRVPEAMKQARLETFFNRYAPFLRAMALYVLAFMLAVGSWLGLPRPLARAALGVVVVALVVHTFGLAARVVIQDRPPVTNLYSSAIFTGWGAAILGAALERFYRNGIGAVSAAAMGFTTLVVAHNLALDGDTMTMMQAVLDTNFWLATHVVVITLGYASTFLAGFLGILYVVRGFFTRSLSLAEAKSLARMIYGIVCFATLFSFVGTILGGIWADQSWGRFWGWDPKENGALLIVLWNALILHARWGGIARDRGLANLAIAGNVVTAWSWFGTNMLGVGLHAYGFIDSAVFWMFVFVMSQFAIIGIGSLPLSRWRSPLVKERARPPESLSGPPTPAA